MAKKFVVTPNKAADRWDVRVGQQTVDSKGTKESAVDAAKRLAKAAPETTQVVIKKRDGTIQTEHTYPRSEDPRRSRG